jgi:NAD-dependent deacetylase
MQTDDSLLRLHSIIQASERIVFFGGAGVSTESGIPDFRSADGLYAKNPQHILHHRYFESNTADFFRFYFDKMVHLAAKPNDAHKALAAMEQQGRLAAVITQNVDGLHQQAGSQTVYELHGSVHRNYCTMCGAAYALADIMPGPDAGDPTPYCECGGVIKPDVVLFGEQLNHQTLQDAIGHIRQADTLIIGGTSLTVYPAASLIQYYSGNALVLINRDATPYDKKADLVINDTLGRVLQGAISS